MLEIMPPIYSPPSKRDKQKNGAGGDGACRRVYHMAAHGQQDDAGKGNNVAGVYIYAFNDLNDAEKMRLDFYIPG